MTKTTHHMLVTSRDRELLEFVYRFRLLSRDQIMALVGFKSLTRANSRLAKLVKAKLLVRKHLPIIPGHGGAQALYHLASSSGRVLTTDPATIIAQSRRASRWDVRQVNHVIAANAILVAFISAARSRPGVQVLGFRTEPELRAAFLGRPFVPDGWFAWAQDGRRFNSFIEVDLGHEGQVQWRKKVFDYLAYSESGLHQETFSFRSFRVLVVAATRARLENLRKTSEHAERLFLFAQLDHITADTIFGSAWLPVQGHDRTSLTAVP
jgi:hypothetical protein